MEKMEGVMAVVVVMEMDGVEVEMEGVEGAE